VYGNNDVAQAFADFNEIPYVDLGVEDTYDINKAEVILTKPESLDRFSETKICPEIKVTYNMDGKEITLNEGMDYSVSYPDDVKQGTVEVVISGLGCYSGIKSQEFYIHSYLIFAEITLAYDSVLYDGTAKEPAVTVTCDGITLEKDVVYTVSYENNIEEGRAKVTVTGIGGCEGTRELYFDIYKNSINDAEITLAYDSVLYDGTAKEPAVTVTYDGTTLEKDTDYTISYESNKEEGQATVTVTGKNNWKGTRTVYFNIYKYSLASADVKLEYDSVLCDGTAKEPTVTVTYQGKTLKNGTDYSVVYDGNIMPGTATVTVTGMGQYKDSKSATFTISAISIEGATVTLNNTIFSYDGSPKKPEVVSVVLDGKTLIVGTDYTVSYQDNVNEGTGYVIVTGTGMYGGSFSQSFTILPYGAGMDSVYDEGDTLISGDYIYMITDDEKNEVELSGISNKKLTKVVVPGTVKNENGTSYKVTSIGQKAFYKNTKLTSVTIGNNVTSIENYAFYGCKNIKTIKIGSKLEIIGTSSFRKCTKLTSITLPKSIDELGKNAFYGCSKLKTITIKSNSVIDVDDNAIKGISKKAVIKVPSKLVKKYKKEFDSKTGFKKTMKIKKK
jgi:hypothetical protein